VSLLQKSILMCIIGSAFAQDLSIGNNGSGQSNFVTFSTLNYSNAIIGSGGSQNALLISNSGTINDQSGYIGYSITSSNNTVFLTGLLTNVVNPDFGLTAYSFVFSYAPTNQPALWNNTNALYVGYAGFSNSLTISNITEPYQSPYISLYFRGQLMSPTVSGSTNPALYIGVVSLASDQVGYVGFTSTASNNSALVTGTNSYWSNATSLSIGYGGARNSMLISNGGYVVDQYGYLGNNNSASNNTAMIAGVNSIWSNSSNLNIGYESAGNTMVISNGGVVYDKNGFLGYSNFSSNNSVVINGAGLYNSNPTSGSALVSGPGASWINSGSLTIGYSGPSNSLLITNLGSVVDQSAYIGYSNTSSNNSVVLARSGSTWSSSSNLYVGYGGAGNRLTITNGDPAISALFVIGGHYSYTTVSDQNGYIGYSNTSSNNSVFLSGQSTNVTYVPINGSPFTKLYPIYGDWENANNFYVGFNGSGNTLTISSNGVVNDSVGYIGYNSSNNIAVVTGFNSFWNSTSSLNVGNGGPGNLLVISNGGVVNDQYGYIGNSNSASNNTALVTGSNSLWSNSSSLTVGNGSVSNSLVISNGGVVNDQYGYIGNSNSASNNTALVTGSNSLWTNSGDFVVGMSGSSNSITITNGGKVVNGQSGKGGVIGLNASASNNSVIISGSNSLWKSSSSLTVGNGGSGNLLVISNGGVVNDQFGYIGNSSTGSNNTALVTGSNSLWSNSSSLTVGNGGVGNSLMISNGGVVNDQSGYIGNSSTGSNNTALVTGSNSLWSNSSSLTVGNGGSGNSLMITNGGRILATAGYVGALTTNISVIPQYLYGSLLGYTTNYSISGSYSNIVSVTGSNSLWSNASSLSIGDYGFNNTVAISNAGALVDQTGYIGFNNTATSNVVFVSGSNSLWSNSSTLSVGYGGISNSLVISNRGTVNDQSGYIGYKNAATSNAVLVTGSNSLWNNTSNVMIGYAGGGNSLIISNGGTVNDQSGYIGYSYTSITNTSVSTVWLLYPYVAIYTTNYSITALSNNSVLVSGINSFWSNASNLTIGFGGVGNSLAISNGGLVTDQTGYIGFTNTASNNSALVTGANSLWSNSSTLSVGYGGVSNSLVISNGGSVSSQAGTIGYINTASNNSVLVTGANSLWSNSSALSVGYGGSSNSLVISNGGTVYDQSGSIGFSNTSSKNSVLVTDSNSVWSNAASLSIGNSASGNSLVISNGAKVVDVAGYMGINGGTNLLANVVNVTNYSVSSITTSTNHTPGSVNPTYAPNEVYLLGRYYIYSFTHGCPVISPTETVG